MSKALSLLKKNRSVVERAEKYAKRIGETIKMELILPLKEKIEAIEDKIFDLENFSLDTNLNKGIRTITKEEATDKFKEIINLRFERDLLKAELKSKLRSYNEYFKDSETTKED